LAGFKKADFAAIAAKKCFAAQHFLGIFAAILEI
jgi:hypothetical protein